MTRLVAVLAVLVGLLGMHGFTAVHARAASPVAVDATAGTAIVATATVRAAPHARTGDAQLNNAQQATGSLADRSMTMPCHPEPAGPGTMQMDCVTGAVLTPSAVALLVGTDFDGVAPGTGAAREWAASSATLDRSPDLIALSISRT